MDFSRILLLIPSVSFTSNVHKDWSMSIGSWAQFNPDLASNSSFPGRLAKQRQLELT